MIDGYFEDASSIDYSLTHKYPFYCFIDGVDPTLFPMHAHWHYFVEILYCIKGQGKVMVNGYPYSFKEGEIIFAFPRDVHAMNLEMGQAFEYIVIKLDPDMLFDSPKEAFAYKHFSQLIAPIPPSLKHLRHGDMRSFDRQDLVEIYQLFMDKPIHFEWRAKSLLLDFVYEYSRYLRAHGHGFMAPISGSDDFSSILPAFDYIHDHYSENLTAASVAHYCHLSYSYFSRQFKKITGITFTKYLNFMRITEAEKLLLDRQHSVTTIGFRVGFTDTSYFIKQFKAFKKMTPKKFMQLVRDDF